MASFASWMLPHKRRWQRIIAGFQDLYNDPGNWSGEKVGVGVLIGTNRSISAPTLIAWRGRMISKQEMMDLSIDEAIQIYKIKYWDKINGDSIVSKGQPIADLLADMRSSAGYNGVKPLQKALNSLGEKLTIDGDFGSKSVTALNQQISKVGVARIFNLFRENMITYYLSINSPFERQLIESLNEDYPPMEESWFARHGATVLIVIVVALLLGYGTYQYKLIQKA